MEIENEADKMAALKRAYADIILNTAKESAARILMSERKALKFQQSLFVVKEEALATILRLKSVMDSKIKEAEMTSLSQVRRIQELEGQLNEAEYTIISLREELERVNKEFMKRNNELVEPSNECKANRQFTSNYGNGHDSPLSLDLASIVTGGKEPELYRNGCTQRIRALEHNSLAVKLPKEQSDVQPSDSLNESDISENGKFERPHAADYFKTVNVVGKRAKNLLTSEVCAHASRSPGNGHTNFLLRSRKPRSKCVQVKSIVCATSHNDNAKDDEASFIRSTKSISEEAPLKLLNSHSPPISGINHADVEGKRLILDTNSDREIPGLLQCNNRTVTEQIVMKHNSEDRDGVEGLVSLNTSTKKMKDAILLIGANQENEAKISQIDDSKLTVAGQNMADVKDELPEIHVNPKVETSGNVKFLKYTFQRTRKRGSSSSKIDSISPEKINGDKMCDEKQNVVLVPQRPTLATELPRNNRRLMQVARQLISLSEKRW